MSDATSGRYPPGFAAWPRRSQVEWAEVSFTRAGLLRMILAQVEATPERHIGRDTKLRKDELAQIHLELENIDHDR